MNNNNEYKKSFSGLSISWPVARQAIESDVQFNLMNHRARASELTCDWRHLADDNDIVPMIGCKNND